MSGKTAQLAIAIAAGTIAFAVVFLLAGVHAVPSPAYLPLDRRWTFDRGALGLSMDWYGAVLVAILAAAVVSLVSFRLARSPRPGAAAGALRIAALVLGVHVAYFAWTVTHQVSSPLPQQNCRPEAERR